MIGSSPKNGQGTRTVFYSIGTDQTLNSKEKITQLHGRSPEVMEAVNELDRYVADPETRKSPWYWNFFKRVKSAIWCLYPHADDGARTRMTREFIDELFNGGYIRVLQSMAVESGAGNVSFAREYAGRYSVSIGAALLFGPRGGATMELLHFLAAEKVHGQHRHGVSPDPRWPEEAKKTWYDSQRQTSWPTAVGEDGEKVPLDVSDRQRHLPEGVSETLREIWRRNPALRYYTGTNRLSGDISYQIIEDVVDMLLLGRFSPLNRHERARYSQIVEDANKKGIDPFYAVYKEFFANKRNLSSHWNRARQWLYDYSLLLWESQSELWLAEGKRKPANGVVYKPRRENRRKTPQRAVPGTIYLNNGRYYWVVARKMKPRPLIDPETRPKVPGSFLVQDGRYYWYVPKWVKRQRLVPNGEKYSTQDKASAEKIALRIWHKLKKKDPKLAATILARTRSQGLATKDRAKAGKIAARLWKQIKRKEPELAATIMQDDRPKAKDHWVAQIIVGGKHRHVGTFKTRKEAQAAYVREFEKIWGYPPGYNVQCIPKIDKVWPSWEEERLRLERMNEHPRMPVIGRSDHSEQADQSEPLGPMIRRMQRVDWLVENAMLVFDDNSPAASPDIAIQSRGRLWYGELKKQGKRAVICGSASVDRDTGRIKITIYNQGLGKRCVLAEEVYHIGFKIIRYTNPNIFAAIQRWYNGQLKKGGDPTFSMADMFATNMALEESGGKTSLPRRVVRQARNIFSPANRVPDSVMEEVKTGWLMPQPA